MKFEVSKDLFAPRLATASRISAGGQAAYRSVVISAADGQVLIRATDGDTEFCGKVEATVERPGEVAVNGKFLAGLVKRLPAWPLVMERDPAGGALFLHCGKHNYDLASDPAWDASALVSLDILDGGAVVEGALLCEGIDRASGCVCDDNSMEAISCLKIDACGQWAATVGLDGHNLARCQVRDERLRSLLGPEGLLLHRATLAKLRKWLPEEGVFMRLTEKRVEFRTEAEAFSVPRSTYAFPAYATILTKAESAATTLEAGREAFLAALDRLVLFTTEEFRGVVVDATADEVTLSAQGDHGKAREILVAELGGKPVCEAIPCDRLAAILRSIKSERVRLSIFGNEGPCSVTGLDDADEGCTFVIMPLRNNTSE